MEENMNDNERKRAAKAFAEYWKDRGDEKSDSQSFWLSLARDVLGVKEPEKFILFEERVKLDHTSFIDGHIPSTLLPVGVALVLQEAAFHHRQRNLPLDANSGAGLLGGRHILLAQF